MQWRRQTRAVWREGKTRGLRYWILQGQSTGSGVWAKPPEINAMYYVHSFASPIQFSQHRFVQISGSSLATVGVHLPPQRR